jgi:hypothetical protein
MILACGCANGDDRAEPLVLDGGFHTEAGKSDAPTPPCTATTCAQSGAECGTAPDGCGGKLDCGACTAGKFCGGAGPNRCGNDPCTPKMCDAIGAVCGHPSDGCSAVLDCGACVAGRICTAAYACSCVATTCQEAGAQCGKIDDGCGGLLDCGNCQGTQICGGDGPSLCGDKPCEPKTCATLGITCGGASDGCNATLDCGPCTLPQTCGGAGKPGQCGCTPVTCAQKGKDCGSIDDGCGGKVDCGACVGPKVCAGAGTPNVCGCNPTACPPFYTNSFESDAEFPNGWVTWHNCAADQTWTVQRDVYPAPGGGTGNLRFHTTAYEASCQWPGAYAQSFSFPATPGKTYRVESSVRDWGNTGGTAVVFFDIGDKEIGYGEVSWPSDVGVYQANPPLVATAPSGATHLQIRVYLNSPLQYADFDLLEVYLEP